MTARRIVANLGFENHLAAGERTPRPLRPEAARAAATLGTLLRVFGSQQDRVWLSGAVALGRIPELPGIASPEFEVGELRTLPPASGWLAWGETEEIADLRARDSTSPPDTSAGPTTPVASLPWQLPPPVPAMAKRFHDRRTHLKIAESMGLALPGARWISTVEDLEAHLSQGAAAIAPDEQWVLKPAFSAAGRSWVRGQGTRLDTSLSARIEALLEERIGLMFEPRLETIHDLAFLISVREDGAKIIGRHEIENGRSGRFRAIRIVPALKAESTAEDHFPVEAEEAVERVAAEMHTLGFRGACGIDTWLGRTADGSLHAQRLGEINARLTFGWLAHAWRERLIETGAIPSHATVILHTSPEKAPPRNSIPLLLAGEHDSMSAWIEFEIG